MMTDPKLKQATQISDLLGAASKGIVFLIASIVGICILVLNNNCVSFFAKVVPFFDSLSYQMIVAHESHGQSEGPVPHVLMFRSFMIGVGRFVDVNQTSLSIYFFSILIFALFLTYQTLKQLKRSSLIAALSLLIIFCVPPLREPVGGFVDQRMDLSSAFFYMILLSSLFFWLEKPSRVSAAASAFAYCLAGLHRFILMAQFAPAIGLFSVLLFLKVRGHRKQLVEQLGLFIGVFTFGLIVFYGSNVFGALDYYLHGNTDVWKVSYGESAHFYFQTLLGYFQPEAAITFLVIFAFFLIKRPTRNEWLVLALVIIAVFSPMLVPVAARSADNPYILLPVIGSFPFIALLFPEFRIEKEVVIGVFVAALLTSGISKNFRSLKLKIDDLPFTRIAASRMLDSIRKDASERKLQQVRISGYTTQSIAAASLAAIAWFDGDTNVNWGTGFALTTDYQFSSNKRSAWTDDEIVSRIRASLDKIASKKSYLLVSDIHQGIETYAVSNYLMPRIKSMVEVDPRFSKVFTADRVLNETITVFRTN